MLHNNVIGYCAVFLALIAAPLVSQAQDTPKPAQTGPAI